MSKTQSPTARAVGINDFALEAGDIIEALAQMRTTGLARSAR